MQIDNFYFLRHIARISEIMGTLVFHSKKFWRTVVSTRWNPLGVLNDDIPLPRSPIIISKIDERFPMRFDVIECNYASANCG
ncbi:hypothetical protein D3C84_1160850 [compost metagenome]